MENGILYSTGCPRCNVLKKKLQEKGIVYTEVNDENIIRNTGITEVPVFSTPSHPLMNFIEAVAWINSLEV